VVPPSSIFQLRPESRTAAEAGSLALSRQRAWRHLVDRRHTVGIRVSVPLSGFKMIIKALEELQRPDEAGRCFTPLGFGPQMRAEDAAEYQQTVIARFDLSAQVPETTRSSFERVRTIYSYGVLCYELYTVAGDNARLVVEQALRDRFLPFYNGAVIFRDKSGAPHEVKTGKFDELYDAIRDNGRLRPWKLQLRIGGDPIRFDGMLTSLLRWARAEGLLDGQRDRMRDGPRIQLRNFVAHPSYHLGMPSDAAADIADLAAIINRLWGAPSGAPVSRAVMAIGWDDQTVTWNQAPSFSTGPVKGTATVVLIRANAEEDLACYDSLYETTQHPCDFLWGPGSWPDAQAWLQHEQPAGDETAALDRMFMIRYHGNRLYLPQAVPIAAGINTEKREGTWYLIRADSPVDAFSHQRQILAGVTEHKPAGHCNCPVETLGEGIWQEELRLAAAAGADIEPQQVPDIRVPISMMPRWNEILGDGNWSVSPIDLKVS
jgi:hypothetical protein